MKTLDVLSTIGALVMAATPATVVGVAHAGAPVPAIVQAGGLGVASRLPSTVRAADLRRVASTAGRA